MSAAPFPGSATAGSAQTRSAVTSANAPLDFTPLLMAPDA